MLPIYAWGQASGPPKGGKLLSIKRLPSKVLAPSRKIATGNCSLKAEKGTQ
jgi:hypothetical protein